MNAGLAIVLAVVLTSDGAAAAAQRTFSSPEAAVRALTDAVKAGNLDEVVAIFGADGQELASGSDPATGRRNREVFVAAIAEGWRLVDAAGGRKTLVIGNEEWPFPVPLIKQGSAWRFDTAAGKEEVIARRIGRNEIAAITTCRTYVAAQRRYAREPHDGRPAGLYAAALASDRGRQNGLYWPAAHGEKRSPLGDLVAQAAADGRALDGNSSPQPFNGYVFRILTAQGSHVTGGAKSYLADGRLSGGFALIAWPSQYDGTGVMTFVVNQDGVVWQKDLGPETTRAAAAIVAYDPDGSWQRVR